MMSAKKTVSFLNVVTFLIIRLLSSTSSAATKDKQSSPRTTLDKTASSSPTEQWKTILTEIHNSHIAIGHLNGDVLKINIEGMEFDLWNFRDFEKLPLVDSPFGRGTQTLIDKTVRKSREYEFTHHIDKALNILGQNVVNNVLGNSYCSVPYKLIVYEKDSFFLSHIDTPEKDLLYTLILVLPSKHKGGDLIFGERFNTTEKMLEPAENINFVLFRINCPHRVEKVIEGYRASIAFKVYKTNENLVDYEHHKPILSDVTLPKLEGSNILLAYPNPDQIKPLLNESGIPFVVTYGGIEEDIKEVYSDVKDVEDAYNECNNEFYSKSREKGFSLIAKGTGYPVNGVINIGFQKSFVELGGETGNEGFHSDNQFKVHYVTFLLINPKESFIATTPMDSEMYESQEENEAYESEEENIEAYESAKESEAYESTKESEAHESAKESEE